jgi:hypothetical protein
MLTGEIELPDFVDPWQDILKIFPDANWIVDEYGNLIIATGCWFEYPDQIDRWKQLLAPAD